MPLNMLPNRGSTGVNGYLHNREPVTLQSENRSLTPQPRRERSNQRANGTATREARPKSSDSHVTNTTKPIRQNFAQSMKLPVPDTLARAKARPTQSAHQDHTAAIAHPKPIPAISQYQLPTEVSYLNCSYST